MSSSLAFEVFSEKIGEALERVVGKNPIDAIPYLETLCSIMEKNIEDGTFKNKDMADMITHVVKNLQDLKANQKTSNHDDIINKLGRLKTLLIIRQRHGHIVDVLQNGTSNRAVIVKELNDLYVKTLNNASKTGSFKTMVQKTTDEVVAWGKRNIDESTSEHIVEPYNEVLEKFKILLENM